MSTIQTPVSKNDPRMIAWKAWKTTDDFQNTRHWAQDEASVDGSLWRAFIMGFAAATERAAALHEQINPASDSERAHGDPGAGAMGAVIEFRDAIRQVEPAQH